MRNRMLLWAALLGAALMMITACAGKQAEEKAQEEKRYSLKGQVVKLDVAAGTATINHENIEGWMEAMTMIFPIQDRAELNKIKVGDTITATVVVRGYDYYLTGIEVVASAAAPAP